ncbi:hypothetical protein [Hydrogenophaga sp.]|uniref:hypothetical protein n=1 Tax=Hydrogenophaga sp. TaxID=1904254 RepID=UPI00286EAA89|nr:hypothetical protein [Hydrogenophaga sp.]
MEWAEGIEALGGQLVAGVVTNGCRTPVRPEKLDQRGLPLFKGKNIVLKNVQLKELVPISADEYLSALGFDATSCDTSRHVVYLLQYGALELYIPALALMRGLFRPSRDLLPELFKPQALDRLCVPCKHSTDTVEIVAKWTNRENQGRLDPANLLSWLYFNPSARKLAESVHRHAMRGRLALELPDLRVHMSVQGKTMGSQLLVTWCNVNRIEQDILDAVSGEAHVNTVRMSCTRKERSVAKALKQLPQPKTHQNGAISLTDEEWPCVLDVLQLTPRELRVRANLRLIVDLILTKLHTNARWVDIEHIGGIPYVNVIRHYSKLVRTGRMQKVLDLLSEMRS